MGDLVQSGSKYTDEDRRAACLTFAVLGNVAKVSQSLGIPATTIYGWRQSDWWDSLSVEVRAEKQEEIVAGLGRIVAKAISETEDRLENGDIYIYQGEIMRAPVKARDSVLIAAVAVDKGLLIQNKSTSISVNSEGMDALLKKFEALARESRVKVVSEQ